jgi:hypothetical protein
VVCFQAKGFLIWVEVTDVLKPIVEGGEDPEHAEQPNPQAEAYSLQLFW